MAATCEMSTLSDNIMNSNFWFESMVKWLGNMVIQLGTLVIYLGNMDIDGEHGYRAGEHGYMAWEYGYIAGEHIYIAEELGYIALIIQRLLECSENIKNHIFYYPDSNYGALTYMEQKSEVKN